MRRPHVSVILFCGLICASAAVAGSIDRTIEQSFDVRPGMRLRVEHLDGNVTVRPSEGARIEVTVVYRAEVSGFRFGGRSDFELGSRWSGDTLLLVGREIEEGGFRLGAATRTISENEYTIRAPADVRLDFEGLDGRVEVVDWQANVAVRLEDGAIDLRRIVAPQIRTAVQDGKIFIGSSRGLLTAYGEDAEIAIEQCVSEDANVGIADGKLVMDRCDGNFEIRSHDGPVTLARHRARELDIQTQDGEVRFDLVDRDPERLQVGVVTEAGDVTFRLGATVDTDFVLRADSGEIDAPIAASPVKNTRSKEAAGRAGKGGGQVVIRTMDGDIRMQVGADED